MNKRERLEAFFRNEPVDHVPCCFWRHYSPELERGEDVVEAHLKFYRETEQDIVKISSDGYFGWPAPELKELTDASQLYGLSHVTMDMPFMTEQVARAKAIVEKLHGECFTFYTLFCPLSIFRLQVGWDKMMQCMKQDPKAVMPRSWHGSTPGYLTPWTLFPIPSPLTRPWRPSTWFPVGNRAPRKS